MANDNKYDFSYFEDSTPYVSHRDRGRPSADNKKSRERVSKKSGKLSFGSPKAMLIGAGAVLIALIVGVIVIINAVSGAVQNAALKVTEVSDSAVTLSWEEKKNTEKYHIYGKRDGEREYTLLSSVSGSETESVTVTELEQASQYSFYITSVKNGTENRFGKAEKVLVLPSPPAFTVSSENEGAIRVSWTPNDKASGYIVEYKKADGEYDPEQRRYFGASDTPSCDITELEPAETYTVRLFSYLGSEKPVLSPPAEEQSVRVSRVNAQTGQGAAFFDKFIDPDKPMVAFTFDDGPFDAVYSDRILDTLEKYDAKATFFMVGCYVEDHPENVRRKLELNMELGNHTWDHSKFGADITAEDISRCSDAIYAVTGERPTGFRPPGGAEGDAIVAEAEAENMAIYLWNVNSEDYETHNADAIYQMVMDTLQDGNIIGMHDTYEATAEAVERLIPEIQAQGYQIVSCHDLVVAKTGEEPVPGKVYGGFAENLFG